MTRRALIFIGAPILSNFRRIVPQVALVAMASACPYQDEYHLAYLYLKRAAF